MKKISAGILPISWKQDSLHYLLSHPGGPNWCNREKEAWSIIKGQIEASERPLEAAIREFKEETGLDLRGFQFLYLGEIKQKSGKIVMAWVTTDLIWEENKGFLSNNITINYKGKEIVIPEIDKLEWCNGVVARSRINPAQIVFLEKIEKMIESEIIII